MRVKQPTASNDPTVGRMSIHFLPPPHTTASIKLCISKSEELDNSRGWQLFTDASSEYLLGDRYISILTGDRPRVTFENPMAFVEPTAPVCLVLTIHDSR